jgi:hypothetical protein
MAPIPSNSPRVTPIIDWIKETIRICVPRSKFDHPSDFSIPISLNRSIKAESCVLAEKITRKMKIRNELIVILRPTFSQAAFNPASVYWVLAKMGGGPTRGIIAIISS